MSDTQHIDSNEAAAAPGALDRVMAVLFSIVPPVPGEGAIAPEETAQRVAAYAQKLEVGMRKVRDLIVQHWSGIVPGENTYTGKAVLVIDSTLALAALSKEPSDEPFVRPALCVFDSGCRHHPICRDKNQCKGYADSSDFSPAAQPKEKS